jgi:hypothetical protein
MLPSLGKRDLVNDPDFRFAEQINHLVRQLALDCLDRPWTLPTN